MTDTKKEGEGGPGMPMAGMMAKMKEMMKGKMKESGFDPMQMCQMMTETISTTAEMALYSTPEIRAMFEDWMTAVDNEILEFVKDQETIEVKSVAEKFNISEKSARFFLNRLAEKGKLGVQYKKTGGEGI